MMKHLRKRQLFNSVRIMMFGLSLTLTTGTGFIMWLGEQITERGIGNGMSLIIFAGIVVNLPAAVLTTFDQLRTGQIGLIRLLLCLGILHKPGLSFSLSLSRRLPAKRPPIPLAILYSSFH